jgi:uncharacterized protein (UPF0276 family)
MSPHRTSSAAGEFPHFDGLPPRGGIGLKSGHGGEILATSPEIGFFEVHAENYMGAGGPNHVMLSGIRERWPLSLHGVGLSIGGEAPLDEVHLARLKALVGRYRPQSFSEHLAWSTHDDAYLNDLLPVAYDTQTLRRICAHIDRVQEALDCRMLLENPSTYVTFDCSTYAEVDFLSEIARRTGCGLLLDVNNVQVTAVNHGLDPFAYIDAFPLHAVGELHLGGHSEDRDDRGDRLLIDTHDSPVAADVWALYRYVIARTGPLPTLVEWDNDVPALCVLLSEAKQAEETMADVASQCRSTPRQAVA